ncbi:MAG TPA: methyltransferase domain-containing protein [Candidatus Limnocylindria bacterium]|nr:methyltransferase domain-containing protein [Candidatus Limnocylindria bacterium]
MPGLPRPLLRRSQERELLEGETLDPREVRANLRELAMLNRLPGGTQQSIEAIRLLADGVRDLRVLDLGTGGGESALAFAAAGRSGVGGWRVVAVDSNPEVFEVARRRTARAPEVELLLADARALPFDDGSVDVAHASLLLHHLDPQDAVAVLGEMARVARRGVVINDLRRGMLPYLITAAVTLALTRSRYTRHDGLASARRAYTIRELDELLHAAGLVTVFRSNPLLPRVVTAAVPI